MHEKRFTSLIFVNFFNYKAINIAADISKEKAVLFIDLLSCEQKRIS